MAQDLCGFISSCKKSQLVIHSQLKWEHRTPLDTWDPRELAQRRKGKRREIKKGEEGLLKINGVVFSELASFSLPRFLLPFERQKPSCFFWLLQRKKEIQFSSYSTLLYFCPSTNEMGFYKSMSAVIFESIWSHWLYRRPVSHYSAMNCIGLHEAIIKLDDKEMHGKKQFKKIRSLSSIYN